MLQVLVPVEMSWSQNASFSSKSAQHLIRSTWCLCSLTTRHRHRNRGGGGGGTGGMCPPSFHKLLYKLLTTLCAVLTVPPQSKVFPTPLLMLPL